MTLKAHRNFRAFWFSTAVLVLLFGVAAGSAHAQHPTYPVLATSDCSNPSTAPGVLRTWYVGPNGSNWTHYNGQTAIANGNTQSAPLADIQFAVSVTQPGDLVCVLAGTYGTFEVYNSGNANNWIKYEVMPGQTVTINQAGAWSGIQVAANYIQISGFNVLGANESLNYNTAVSYESDPADHPDYNGGCINVTGAANGVTYPNHVNILQNVTHECPGGGIGANGADYVVISGNEVFDNAWYGAEGGSAISMLNDYDSHPDGTTAYKDFITNNAIYNNFELIPWAATNTISDGEGIIIDSNYNGSWVSPNNKATYPAYTGYTLIANNVISRNGSAAIEVFESAYVDVLSNSTYGDVVTSQDQPKTGSQTGELLIYTASYVRALNNIFYAYGNSSPLFDHDACGNCYFDSNTYFGTIANHYPNGQGANDAHSNYLNPNYVSVQPQPFNNNLAIASPYSDVLTYGTGWLNVPIDFTGKTRTVTGSYTVAVGAYAYP